LLLKSICDNTVGTIASGILWVEIFLLRKQLMRTD
jgi:hypothetical protein